MYILTGDNAGFGLWVLGFVRDRVAHLDLYVHGNCTSSFIFFYGRRISVFFMFYLGGFDITFIIDCHDTTGTFDVVRYGQTSGLFCASHGSTRSIPLCSKTQGVPRLIRQV